VSLYKPYSIEYAGLHDGMYYLHGPSPDSSCSYYASNGTTLRFLTSCELDEYMKLANMAFNEGYKSAQRHIRASLGIKE